MSVTVSALPYRLCADAHMVLVKQATLRLANVPFLQVIYASIATQTHKAGACHATCLQLDIANGREARITEFGWLPDCFAPGACPNRPGGTANLDDTAPSCDGAQPAISGAIDYNAFVRNYAGAGGAAVWLLSAPSGFDNWAAVPEGSGAQPRPWFTQYIDNLNAE